MLLNKIKKGKLNNLPDILGFNKIFNFNFINKNKDNNQDFLNNKNKKFYNFNRKFIYNKKNDDLSNIIYFNSNRNYFKFIILFFIFFLFRRKSKKNKRFGR